MSTRHRSPAFAYFPANDDTSVRWALRIGTSLLVLKCGGRGIMQGARHGGIKRTSNSDHNFIANNQIRGITLWTMKLQWEPHFGNEIHFYYE